jgi:hypothetical protein
MQQLCKASAEKRVFLDDKKIAIRSYLVKRQRPKVCVTRVWAGVDNA